MNSNNNNLKQIKTYIEDTETAFSYAYVNYKEDSFLISYPYFIFSKKKIVLAYLYRKLSSIISQHNFVNLSKETKYKNLKIKIKWIQLTTYEKESLELKMNLLNENISNTLHEKISLFLDTFIPYNKNIFFSLGSIINNYLENNIYNSFPNITEFNDIVTYLRTLKNDSNENYKNKFEEKLIEFLLLLYFINEQFPNLKETCDPCLQGLQQEQNEDKKINEEKKSCLKPYNRDDILLQSTCEVDYGNKKINKKEIKKREKSVQDAIDRENKKIGLSYEDKMIKSTFNNDYKPKIKIVNVVPTKVNFLSKIKG